MVVPRRSRRGRARQPHRPATADRLGDTVTVLDATHATRKLPSSWVGRLRRHADLQGVVGAHLVAGRPRDLTAANGYAASSSPPRPAPTRTGPADAVSAALDAGTASSPESELRPDLAEDSAKYVEGFLITMLASTIVALVVACLVVYNTFTILVAQRSREIALLRCLGASRRQIVVLVHRRGLPRRPARLGRRRAVQRRRRPGAAGRPRRLRRRRPRPPLVIARSTVVVALVVGYGHDVASGVLPALAAARVAPLAAMRDGRQPRAGRPHARRRMHTRTVRRARRRSYSPPAASPSPASAWAAACRHAGHARRRDGRVRGDRGGACRWSSPA